jgi:DNA processing protein
MIKFKTVGKDANNFPQKLLSLPDCPNVLEIAGEITKEDNFALAVVGSRKMSSYGREVTEDIVKQVVLRGGVTIVSGFMHGVDLTAHKAAFENGGRTIGVLGFGSLFIDNVPDIFLARKITESRRGAIISEFSKDQPPQKWTFPKRDRIIAGLSCSILVIEAAEKSGTFYTVEASIQQGKEVLAVPGSIYNDVSKGCHKLIEDGARIVKSAQDVLDTLNIFFQDNSLVRDLLPANLSVNENVVLECLDQVGIFVDDIIFQSRLSSPEVLSSLTNLEIKGYVRDVGGGFYRRI